MFVGFSYVQNNLFIKIDSFLLISFCEKYNSRKRKPAKTCIVQIFPVRVINNSQSGEVLIIIADWSYYWHTRNTRRVVPERRSVTDRAFYTH